MKLSEQLKRLIAANAPLWAGEAEIARTWLLATLVADSQLSRSRRDLPPFISAFDRASAICPCSRRFRSAS